MGLSCEQHLGAVLDDSDVVAVHEPGPGLLGSNVCEVEPFDSDQGARDPLQDEAPVGVDESGVGVVRDQLYDLVESVLGHRRRASFCCSRFL